MMKFSHLGRSWELYDVLYMWVIPSLVANKYNVPLLWNCPGVPIPFSENDSNIVNILCNSADYIEFAYGVRNLVRLIHYKLKSFKTKIVVYIALVDSDITGSGNLFEYR